MLVRRLYKYLSISSPESWHYRRKLIVDRELYFNDPENFNDPLDCNIASAAKHQGMLHKVKVFCLCEEARDDALMFAHYGDHHRGFRLTFTVDMELSLGEIGVLGYGEDVEYARSLPVFDNTDIHKSLLTKSSSWQYEAEYRIFAVHTDTLYYDKDSLVEVAFGYRMNPDFEPVIRKWVKEGGHKNTTFFRAFPSTKKLGFEYIPVP